MESMAAAARRLRLLLRSTAVLYLLAAAFLLGSAGVLYSRFTFAAFSDSYTPPSPGCRPDGEGSWSIGLFYGESPLKLQPLELREMWRNESAAWPVANPVFTCASVLDARSPSNFVADPFLHILAIEKRIAVFSQVPAENGELIQVLRYEANQFYKPHHDYFSDTYNLKRGGQRVATMLMYLSDDVEGGETYFPLAGDSECSCGGKMMKGVCVKPVKGDAVLFWSMGLNGESDPKSLHGGCEVLKGEKWSATKWMRQRTTF